jgi:hypothetical protein
LFRPFPGIVHDGKSDASDKNDHQPLDDALHRAITIHRMSCPACFAGHVNDATPTGRIEKVHGRETYVAEPKSGSPPKGIIVIIPDAFGLQFVNNQLLADHYAARGDYKVYLPDFMDGVFPLHRILSKLVLTDHRHCGSNLGSANDEEDERQ